MDSFRSNQIRDYPIQFKEFSRGYIRYLYARSADSRASDSEGQDYLAWRYTENALGFVICDGVGGSFCGNIAAKYLGEQLIKFLFDVGPTLEELGSPSALAEKAMGYLSDWREGGHKLVETVELPKGLPPLQLQALQQLRREQGSETIFVCGRLSFGERPKLILIWMGDTEVRVFDHQGQRVEIGGLWRNSDRWSTKYGIGKRGIRAHAWMGDVEEHRIDRIIAFSDGLSVAADKLHKLQDHELQETVGKQLMSSLSDDISFFDVRLKPSEPPHGIPVPQELRMTDNKIVWSSVKGADSYQLEEAANGVFYESKPYETKKAEWPLDDSELKPETAYRYYRVRTCAGKWPKKWSSQWSQALRLRPPALSAPERVEIQDSPDEPGTYTISWSEVKGAQYYVLSEQFGQQQEREIYLGPERRYTVTRQEPGTYRYRARACGPAGQSDPGVICEKEVATIPTVPEPGEEKDNTLTEPVVKVVLQEEAPSSAVEVPQKVAAVPIHESDRLREATQAQLGIGIGLRQEVSSPAIELERPRLYEMRAVRVNQPYQVRWSEIESAERYELQAAESDILFQSGNFSTVYTGRDLLHEVIDDRVGTRYYRVRALGYGQQSNWSDVESVKVEHASEPKAPDLYIDNPSGDASYVVRWSHTPNADWYELQEAKIGRLKLHPIYYNVMVGDSRKIRMSQEIRISEKQPGTYYYRVRACNTYGCSKYSSPVSMEVKEPLPEAPELYLIDNPDKRSKYWVRWAPVKLATFYVLFEAQNPDFNKAKEVYADRSHSHRLEDREPGVYYYRVFACNSQGDYGKPSNTVRTEVALETPVWGWPSKQEVNKDFIHVKLTWQYVRGAERYELCRPDVTGDRPIAEPTSNSHIFPLSKSKGIYHFRVRAVSRQGIRSSWSCRMRVVVYRDVTTNQLGLSYELMGT